MSITVLLGDGADTILSSTIICITTITGLTTVDFLDTVGTIHGTLIADGEDLIGHGDGTEIHFTSIRTAIMLGDGDTTLTCITIHTGTVSIEEI
jgi:hypothetical protein